MSSSKGVPDAWDDDWVDKHDSSAVTPEELPAAKKPSKAERRRQQLEVNKKLWEEAESPSVPYFVQNKDEVPLQSGFTSAVKVLSRNPASGKPSSGGLLTNLRQPGLQDDCEEDDEEIKHVTLTADERAERARKELEEKQKKYEEARQKIFGDSTATDARGQNSSASLTRSRGHHGAGLHMGGGGERPRARGRGAASSRGSPSRQLYDPNGSRFDGASSPSQRAPADGHPIRSPRGPDGSGQGGRGFVNRGGRGNGLLS